MIRPTELSPSYRSKLLFPFFLPFLFLHPRPGAFHHRFFLFSFVVVLSLYSLLAFNSTGRSPCTLSYLSFQHSFQRSFHRFCKATRLRESRWSSEHHQSCRASHRIRPRAIVGRRKLLPSQSPRRRRNRRLLLVLTLPTRFNPGSPFPRRPTPPISPHTRPKASKRRFVPIALTPPHLNTLKRERRSSMLRLYPHCLPRASPRRSRPRPLPPQPQPQSPIPSPTSVTTRPFRSASSSAPSSSLQPSPSASHGSSAWCAAHPSERPGDAGNWIAPPGAPQPSPRPRQTPKNRANVSRLTASPSQATTKI